MKPNRAWDLPPSGELASMREMADANGPKMCNDKQPNMI
jgi:hypothetical protein